MMFYPLPPWAIITVYIVWVALHAATRYDLQRTAGRGKAASIFFALFTVLFLLYLGASLPYRLSGVGVLP